MLWDRGCAFVGNFVLASLLDAAFHLGGIVGAVRGAHIPWLASEEHIVEHHAGRIHVGAAVVDAEERLWSAAHGKEVVCREERRAENVCSGEVPEVDDDRRDRAIFILFEHDIARADVVVRELERREVIKSFEYAQNNLCSQIGRQRGVVAQSVGKERAAEIFGNEELIVHAIDCGLAAVDKRDYVLVFLLLILVFFQDTNN